jgi:orotidine-5'-phosphate decarboxylase
MQSKIGLVVGATDPQSLKRVSESFPAFWILAPGLGAQGGDVTAAVLAAGERAIFPISRGIYKDGKFRDNAERFRNSLNKLPLNG